MSTQKYVIAYKAEYELNNVWVALTEPTTDINSLNSYLDKAKKEYEKYKKAEAKAQKELDKKRKDFLRTNNPSDFLDIELKFWDEFEKNNPLIYDYKEGMKIIKSNLVSL